MDYLCDQPHDRARRDALKSLPPDLNSTYVRILERVNGQGPRVQALVQRTLRWIIYSRDRLDNAALCVAVSIEADKEYLDPDAQPTIKTILKNCSSLIRRSVDGRFLELAHFTVEEFLTKQHDLPSTIAPYLLTKETSHVELAKTCLTYLNLKDFDQDLFEDYDDWNNALEASHFREHAVIRFSLYAEGHWEETALFGLAKQLFWPTKTKNFLRWAQDHFLVLLTVFLSVRYIKFLDRMLLKNFPGLTPLHYAAGLRILPLCEWLIKNGCSVNKLGSMGSPLHWALLQHDAALFAADYTREDFSVSGGKLGLDSTLLELLKLFVDSGADARSPYVGYSGTDFPTLAMLGRESDNLNLLPEAVGYLLKAKARVDEDFIDNMRESYNGRPTQVRCILDCFQEDDIDDYLKSKFWDLCKHVKSSSPMQWKSLSRDCGSTVSPSIDDIELFHHAARMDYPEKLKRMLETCSVDVNSTTAEFNDTALHVAAENGSYDSAKVLLDAGADINTRNSVGETPLHWCVRSMGGAIVSLLLDHGACTEDVDDNGCTVFHAAAADDNVEVLRNLVEHPAFTKAELARRNTDGLTPILVAAQGGSENSFLSLLEASDDLSGASSKSGSGIIHFSLNLSLKAFEAVLSKDIDHGLNDALGRTALHICCEGEFSDQSKKVSMLIGKGVDP